MYIWYYVLLYNLALPDIPPASPSGLKTAARFFADLCVFLKIYKELTN